ncbi:MAG: hypothetical protein DI624_06520 [Brevundimonas sp.]|uniref:hypothetical protein n=1 Tax=Brevundimonas sp. TaxID=1871086 RepID=UPI000DB10C27|nr:hypothetical protein [Brevundimonas sp.]PZT99004.1 MAG: hypothetical protein DI624_06520 [Brevundimonas sp.]
MNEVEIITAGKERKEASRRELQKLRQAARAKYDGMQASIMSACQRHIAIIAAEQARVDQQYAHLRGWSRSAPQRQKKHSGSFREAVATGFDILARGAEAKCLEGYASGSTVKPVPGRMNFTFYTYWGWIREAINTLEPNPVSSRLKDLLAELAAAKGIFSRKGGAELRRKAGLKGLHELAAELHISHSSLRTIAVRLGLTDASSRRAQSHCFDRTAVSQLKDVLDDLISRREAARLVNLSLAGFDEFCFRRSIQPLIRLKGRSPSADQFRRSELAAAIARDGSHGACRAT